MKKFLSLLFILALSPISLVALPSNLAITAGQFSFLLSLPVPPPRLLTQDNTTRALALDATTFLAEPFSLIQVINSGPDPRTRLLLVATDIDPIVGPNPYNMSADAEDESHRIFPLAVEYVDKLPINSNYAIHIRLNDEMSATGDVLVRLYYDGVASNRVRVGLGRVGGGPPDDIDPNPSPSPSASPTPTPTPFPSPSPSASPTPSPTPQNLNLYPTAIGNLSLTPAKTAYYRFSEISGTLIADSSGGSHTGTLSGAVSLNQSSLLTSDSNASALFAGGKVISANAFAAPTSGLTISCLVSHDPFAPNSNNSLVSLGTNTPSGIFSLHDASSFGYSFTATDGTSQNFYFPNEFQSKSNRIYHLVIVHDFINKTVKLYQDGLLATTQTYTVNVRASSSQPVQVGNNNVNAYIDEVLVTEDKVLSDDDVYNLFRASRGVDTSRTTIYVSPTGSYRATGSATDPIDFYTAIRSGYAKPGGSYNLKAGDYQPTIEDGFNVIAAGKSNARLTIQNNPGEHVRILQPYDTTSANYAMSLTPFAQYVDLIGNWSVNGSQVRTFEITNTGTDRQAVSPATAQPPDEVNGRGAYSLIRWDTRNSRMIGLIIHDGGVGCDITQASGDSSWIDNVGFNNGSDHGNINQTGMTFYTQNESGVQRFVNNVLFRNFNYNFQGYGNMGNLVSVHVEGGIFFDAGAPAGALRNDPNFRQNNIFIGTQNTPQQDTVVTNVDTYMAPLARGANINVGYFYPSDLDATITNNRIFGGPIGIALRSHATGTITGNFIYTRRSDVNVHYLTALWPRSGSTAVNFVWNSNTYYDDPDNGGSNWIYNDVGYTFAEWKNATGFDLNGTGITARYQGTMVRLHPSTVRFGYSSIAIANFSLATSVPVNLSAAGLVNGQGYRIIDLERVLENDAVVYTGVYSPTNPVVSVPINNTQPTQPYGVTGISRNREFRAYLVVPG